MDKKQFKQFAEKTVKKYKKILLLDSYNIDIEYKVSDSKNYGEIGYAYPYKDYIIGLSPELLSKDKQFVEGIIVHELCHILSDPLVGKSYERFTTEKVIEDERERLTDHLKNIITKIWI